LLMTTSSPRKRSKSPKPTSLSTPTKQEQNGFRSDPSSTSSSSSSSSRRVSRRCHRSRGNNDRDHSKPTMVPHASQQQTVPSQHQAYDALLHARSNVQYPHHASHHNTNNSAADGSGAANQGQHHMESAHGSPQREQGLSAHSEVPGTQVAMPPLTAAPHISMAEQNSTLMPPETPPPEPLRVPVAVYVPPSVLFPGSRSIKNGFANNHQAISLEPRSIENATTADMIYLQVL